jgi:hypothetical protein
MIKLLLFILITSCATKAPIKDVGNVEIDTTVYNKSFDNKSKNKTIINSVKLAECVLSNRDFQKEIINHGSFEHYEGSNKYIVDQINSDKKSIVSSYIKRISRASAYRKVGTNKIYINRAKLGSFAKTVRSLVHEHMHVLGFKHKGNGRNINNNAESVPYKVSTMTTPYTEKCL